jgi:hypothetical protein
MAKSTRLNIEANNKFIRETVRRLMAIKIDLSKGTITQQQADYTVKELVSLFRAMSPEYWDVLIGSAARNGVAKLSKLGDSLVITNTEWE